MKRTIDKESDHHSSELNHKLYKAGCDFFEKKEFKKAGKAFSEALEYWPQDTQAWFALGNCYDELNKPAKAEKAFKKALQLCAQNKQSDILYNLGNSLLDQAKFEEAIEYYKKVSAQSSAYRAAQINMERAINGNPNKNS
ncbi:MAG: tetratricopeptide repeat protein [Candidatus Thiodiazotropha sp. (ex Rostrolucina anterorostrata)]|nr:tetratricopeptide repeat protein [Candidatus Thiodiazotropha sp. (ex Rostrolucina anterorostrata)]